MKEEKKIKDQQDSEAKQNEIKAKKMEEKTKLEKRLKEL